MSISKSATYPESGGPESKTSNIFYMEFMVNDMRLWRLPPGASEIDPMVFDFRYLDKVRVSIDKDQYDLTSTNVGKNCLFVLDAQPSTTVPIEFDVFKKTSDEARVQVGKGVININEELANLFRVSLPPAPTAERTSTITNPRPSVRPNPERTSTNTVRTSANPTPSDNPDNASITSEPVTFPITLINKAWHPVLFTNPPEQKTPSQTSANSASKVSRQSKTSENGPLVQVGVVLVRLRITCLGPSIVSTLVQNKRGSSERGVYNCDDLFHKCPSLMPEKASNVTKSSKELVPRKSVKCDCTSSSMAPTECAKLFGCPSNIYINSSSLNCEKMDRSKEDFMPVPQSSTTDFGKPQPVYEEFRTCFGENELLVRVPKDTRTVCQINDNDELDSKICRCPAIQQSDEEYPPKGVKWSPRPPQKFSLTVNDDGNDMLLATPCTTAKFINSCGLPLVRGNLKYPTRFELSSRLAQCADMAAPGYQQMKSDPKNCCIKCERKVIDTNKAPYPEGIEVCKKFSANPNIDVYVLKLPGTKGGDGSQDKVELELHTPRSPTAPIIQETQDAQTYEEDFCEPYKAGKAGKPGKAKAGKDKKAKK